jgi:hypothetical protein
LSTNSKYLKSAQLKRSSAYPSAVHEKIQKQHHKTYLAQLKKQEKFEREGKDDKVYLDAYLQKVALFFPEEEYERLAFLGWIHSIGTMGQFAGTPEMVLFLHMFNIHVITLKNMADGVQFDNTYRYTFVSNPDCTDKEFPKPHINKSIYLWAVNPKDPRRPVHGSDEIKHFVTLNYTELADVLLSKDRLTFEKIKYNQDNCHPIVETKTRQLLTTMFNYNL